LLALTLLALGMLRSLVRTPAAPLSTQAASEKSAVSAASPQASDAQEPEEASEPARVLKARFSGSGPDLKQELQEIVKENPDAAATILRAWIGEAA
jgi:flagellar M-ring protein FliF